MFAFFVAAVLSVSLTACPDDPVTPEPETPETSTSNPSGSDSSAAFSFVGTWKGQTPEGDVTLNFNADGTVQYVEYEYKENGEIKHEYKVSGAYKYDDKSKTLTFFTEREVLLFKVEVISSTVVVLELEGGDYPLTLKKQ